MGPETNLSCSYMSCYTVKVSGTGNTLPASTVSFPGAYTAKDPGILFDLYGSYSTYVIPGPLCFFIPLGLYLIRYI